MIFNYKTKSVVFLFIVLSIFTFFANGQEKKVSKEAQIDAIFKDYLSGVTPGCAVVVVNKGKIVFLKTYGYANIEDKIPVTSKTMFDLASNSKQFTAYCISQLVESRKISLDDDMIKYLPELFGLFNQKIIISNLVHHSSGLRGMYGTMLLTGWTWSDFLSNRDYMLMLRKQRELNFKPGEELEYNNANYVLLAEIIERISGKSFKEVMEENVFKVLGMKSTVVAQDSNKIIYHRAQPYSRVGESKYEKYGMPNETVGASSIYTNIEDLGLWIKNYSLYRGKKNKVIERMFNTETLNSGKINNYCFGINANYSEGEERTYTHLGSSGGYNSYTLLLPDRGFGVGVIGNDAYLRAYDKGLKVTQILFPDIFGPLKAQSKNKKVVKKKKQPLKQEYMIDKDFYKSYEGMYCVSEFQTYLIRKEGGQLIFEYVGGTPSVLNPQNKHSFLVGKSKNTVKFKLNQNGDCDGFIYTRYGQKREAKRIIKKNPGQIKELCGRYHCSEIDVNIEISHNEKHFIVKHFRWENKKLYPSKPDTLVGYKSYFKKLTFYRNKQGEIKGFKLYGHTIRNLRFKKIVLNQN